MNENSGLLFSLRTRLDFTVFLPGLGIHSFSLSLFAFWLLLLFIEEQLEQIAPIAQRMLSLSK